MVNIKKPVHQNSDFQDSWDVELLNVLHNKDKWRKSLKQYYPRPVLLFTKDKVQYTIPKRCERIFSAPSDTATKYEVPAKVRDQYGSILEDYKKNYGHIDETFLTKVQHQELTDGDLVYFFANKDKVVKVKAIMPVPLSRITDDKPMGEKLPDKNLLPCDHDNIEYDSASSHPEGLCPACRLFGTTNYKGRVRFGFARLKENTEPKWHKDGTGSDGNYKTLPLLECPRPTGSIPEDNEIFKVPGRKFYVHHNGREKEENNRSENHRSLEPLPKDSEFTFDVFFENLEKWELGLLLYSLELEPENNLAHKMGMAKAHGFGSVQIAINKISFRVNPIMYKMVNGNRCKNRLIDAGYAQLQAWDGKGKEWHNIPRIQKLRKLLKYEHENKRKVEYPELERKGGFPGYNELGDGKNWSYEDRVACLTTPWATWYPYKKAPKEKTHTPYPSREGNTKSPLQGEDSGVGKGQGNYEEGAMKTEGKPNIPLAKKCTGTVKWFNGKKGVGFIAKDDGEDVFVHISAINGGIILKEGQKVVFDIAQSEKGLQARNVKINK